MQYFAYGSNMSRTLMSAHCPNAQALGCAVLDGWRFLVTTSGYASIMLAPGRQVHGVLWRLTPRDLAALNAYESVDSGLYRYSRNPIYLGLSTIHLGVAVADNNAWLPILLVPVLAILRLGVVAREETYLARKFGPQYVAYKARVRRWL